MAREIQQAFFQLAREGVGSKRGQFMIENIQKTLFSPHSLTLLPAPKPVRFVFETPTLLKQNNAVLKTAPSLNVLMQRILFRVESILQLDRPADAPESANDPAAAVEAFTPRNRTGCSTRRPYPMAAKIPLFGVAKGVDAFWRNPRRSVLWCGVAGGRAVAATRTDRLSWK